MMALWRSWLARRPVTAEVAGSSPVRVAILNASSGWSWRFLLLVSGALGVGVGNGQKVCLILKMVTGEKPKTTGCKCETGVK